MATLPTRVYATLNESGIMMRGAKNSHKGLRQQIATLQNRLANTPGLQLMPLVDKREQVYPLLITDGTGGFLGLRIMEYCFLGVNAMGEGCISAGSTTFDDFLIYFCNYDINAINYVFERAQNGDPMTFDEAEQMDLSGNTVYQNNINNTVHSGQIVNASGHARVSAPVNINESIPPQFQVEYYELVNFLQNANDTIANKNLKITEFIQKLTVAGFGAVVGQVAQFLFSLI